MENTFIYIDDIKGESLERNHKEWIPAKTLSWEVTRTLDMDDLGTTQRGYANSSFGKVSVSTELSVASPKLMLSVADGTVRKEIKIEMCRSGDSSGHGMEPYLIWKLYDVVIDTAGVPTLVDAVREGGRFVTITPFSAPTPEDHPSVDVRLTSVEISREDLQDVVARAASGAGVLPDVESLPLEAAGRAHARLEAGGVRGKLVLVP